LPPASPPEPLPLTLPPRLLRVDEQLQAVVNAVTSANRRRHRQCPDGKSCDVREAQRRGPRDFPTDEMP
jgi:hypothetical protein